jgi:hypothetical protein
MSSTAEPTDPLTRPVKLLGILAIAALLWSVYEGAIVWQHGRALQTLSAPRGIVSLALAPTPARARGILGEWRCGERDAGAAVAAPCALAREALSLDARFVRAYSAAWILIPLWARIAGKVSPKTTALVIAGVLAGALFDVAENRLLGTALASPTGVQDRLFTLARLAAMHKFVLLLLAVAGGVTLSFGAVRKLVIDRWLWRREIEDRTAAAAHPSRHVGRTWSAAAAPMTVDHLMQRETRGIFEHQSHRTPDRPVPAVNAAADEQYVSFREADMIGLALSGGGIRSATFNLGLLQELHCIGLLPLVDYLSTVSGGGYVGSFWSAWLKRLPERLQRQGHTRGSAEWDEAWRRDLFPTAREQAPHEPQPVESDQERHLREFSGFLAPRWGFFEIETWTAIVAVLGGLVPALLIGLSVIGVTIIGWLALTFPLASGEPRSAPTLAIAVISAAVFILFEKMWQDFRRETAGHPAKRPGHGSAAVKPHGDPLEADSPEAESNRKEDSSARGRRRHAGFAVAAVVLIASLQYSLPWFYERYLDGWWPIFASGRFPPWQQAPSASGLLRWWAISGIDHPPGAWTFSSRLFDYGIVWLVAGLALIAWRTTSAVLPRPWRRESQAAFDRVLMRTLGMSATWVGLALLWHVAMNMPTLAGTATSAAISAGIFAALRNWIGVALRRPSQAGVIDRLKPMLPALLAYLTLILTAVTVGGVLIQTLGADWFSWWGASAMMTALLVLALFITPEEFGLHAFYRDRIARAYAGAANLGKGQGASDNRGTEPRDGDDPRFTELVSRPLHLVCCAANDLSGDQVETLNRGARSAVLSKHGFSLGRHARAWHPYAPANRLGSGITASAAAFNSNMGHISVRVGPAVSFLMTMLNLRLGLWVRHPMAAMAGARRWPGLLYYREMLGLTSSSGRLPEEVPTSLMRDIHLSDGGHFENLALYELVRRHCRYIIVSDCGADPTVAFDDLGNALRRVREDFGVDVALDVAPLRPDATGMSRQHVAVGKIKYSETDTGILLYIKPSVTGDEPPDVLQYRTRNLAFPHEATTDQFYDEAQWESYRRLGRHAAERVFEFVRREDSRQQQSADWVFAEAARQWGATPEGLEDRVLEMTRRFSALDAELEQRLQLGLLTHVFPEITEAAVVKALGSSEVGDQVSVTEAAGCNVSGHSGTASGLSVEDAMAAELSLLLRVVQVMEDVWVACQLDRWWGHPLNMGWVNLFARWATSPPFQFWWPLLSPMFSPGFRQFIQQRFPMRADRANLASANATPQEGRVEPIAKPERSGLAAIWWEERTAQPARWNTKPSPPCGRTFYQNLVELKRGDRTAQIQVGLAAVTTHGWHAGWTSDDFFVPPSLWGAGFGGHFLRGLLNEVSKHASWALVVVKAPPPGQAHQVARDDRQAFIEHYKKVGFRETRPDHSTAKLDPDLCRELGYDEKQDMLLTLDLEQWGHGRTPARQGSATDR